MKSENVSRNCWSNHRIVSFISIIGKFQGVSHWCYPLLFVDDVRYLKCNGLISNVTPKSYRRQEIYTIFVIIKWKWFRLLSADLFVIKHKDNIKMLETNFLISNIQSIKVLDGNRLILFTAIEWKEYKYFLHSLKFHVKVSTETRLLYVAREILFVYNIV